MADDELMQTNETEKLDRWAMYVSLATAVFMIVLWVVAIVFAPEPGFAPARDVNLAALTAASLLSAALAWRGRSRYGIWLFIIINYSIALYYVWFNTAGMGPVVGILTLLVTGSVASVALPRRYVNRTIVGTAIGTLLIIIGDSLSPIDRPEIADARSIIAITVISLLVYGVFILRQFPYYTLRTKLIIAFIGISTFSVAIIGNVMTTIVEDRLSEQIQADLARQTDKLSDFMGSVFLQKAGQLQAIVVSKAIHEVLPDYNAQYRGGDEAAIKASIQELDEYWLTASDDDPFVTGIFAHEGHINPIASQLYDYLENFPDHSEIIVTDRYGATVGATGRLSDYYQADEEWWQVAWNDGEGAAYISDPTFDESAGVTAVLLALPVKDEDSGEVIGVIRSTLLMDDLFEVIADQQFGETGRAVLVDKNGGVLFEQIPAGEELGSEGLSSELRAMLANSSHHVMIDTNEHGDLSIFAHTPIHLEGFAEFEQAAGGEEDKAGEFKEAVAKAIDNLGWVIMLRQEAAEAFAAVGEISRTIQLVALIVVVVAGVLATIFAITIVRPIQALGEAAEAIGAGNLHVPLPAATGDEIGQLTTEFANMTNQLQQTVGELQRRTLVIETSSEVSRHLSTILNEQELVTAVVNQVQRSFNYYHAHIYLMNEQGNRLLMMGGTGHAGQEMLNRKHSIRVGVGLVGRAAASKLPVLVSDVKDDPNWLPNPLLPETLSEVAIPIMRSDQVLGVLDVQHNIINGLLQQDVELLNLIANQVAVALQNARSYTQAQRQANQQALINEIGQRLQTATTVERTLQIAAEELGQALGTQRTTIQLNSDKRTNGR